MQVDSRLVRDPGPPLVVSPFKTAIQRNPRSEGSAIPTCVVVSITGRWISQDSRNVWLLSLRKPQGDAPGGIRAGCGILPGRFRLVGISVRLRAVPIWRWGVGCVMVFQWKLISRARRPQGLRAERQALPGGACHRRRVDRSCIQNTSGLSGEVMFSGRSRLVTGGKVRGSCHTLISECPSANDRVAALL